MCVCGVEWETWVTSRTVFISRIWKSSAKEFSTCYFEALDLASCTCGERWIWGEGKATSHKILKTEAEYRVPKKSKGMRGKVAGGVTGHRSLHPSCSLRFQREDLK